MLYPVLYVAFYYLIMRLCYDEAMYEFKFARKRRTWLHVVLRTAPWLALAALAVLSSQATVGWRLTIVTAGVGFISVGVADRYVFSGLRNDVMGITVGTFAQQAHLPRPVWNGCGATRSLSRLDDRCNSISRSR